MREVLKEVQNGTFAKQWVEENKQGKPTYNKLIQQDFDHQIEKVGAELRARMPWLNDKRA